MREEDVGFENQENFSRIDRCGICLSPNLETVGNKRIIDSRSDFVVAIKKCLDCSHWITDPMPNATLLARLYSEGSPAVIGADAEEYSTAVASRNLGSTMASDSHWVVKSLSTITPRNFLEVGCGDGSLLRKFRSLGWLAYGVDMGSYACGQQVVSSADELPKEILFDAIVFQDVIEHFSDPIRELATYMNVLSPNAFIFMAVPWSESKRASLTGQDWEMVRPLGHLHYFSKQSAKILFDSVGCEVHSWMIANPFRHYPNDPDDVGDQLYIIAYRRPI